uniref:Uncharacterized protein n=1 Tax=Arundo donax TaxID=35708 RepID=A0A0A9FQD0_ARUDO
MKMVEDVKTLMISTAAASPNYRPGLTVLEKTEQYQQIPTRTDE